jgi:2,3-dimethylmalate lyase
MLAARLLRRKKYMERRAMTERQRPDFRARLANKELLVAPGVFDGISARIADQMGFEALYMTGYGTVASHLGLPDAGIASYTDMVGRVKVLAETAKTPLMADGDTGYGGLLNVQYTVRGYEAAGAVAIQLEDQEFPKKCGHMLGRRIVPLEDMVDKIKVAVASRDSADFLIIARTDARTTLGLDEALRRADAYAKAGADILFVESPESLEEMRTIGRSFDRPLMANMVEGGRTPLADRKTLEEIGYSIAIFPGLGFLAAGAALQKVYRHLKEHGSSVGSDAPLYKFAEFSDLMGFGEVTEFDQTYRR